MTNLRPIAIALAALILGACAQELTALRETAPTGSEFTRQLTREYLSFAEFEAEQMIDWPDARHFAAKGLQTAAGSPVEPENPVDWNLPEHQVKGLIEAHQRLVETLQKGARDRLPKVAAMAQARFDCWVEQQEENWQRHHIAACRQGFDAAMEQLDKPAPRTIQFAFDSATLEAADLDLLVALAGNTRKLQGAIEVAGHADRAGSEAHNMGLSKRRAAAVGAVLHGLGIPRQRLALSAHGEGRPRIATPDGTRERRNRRVEITVLPKPRQPGATANLTPGSAGGTFAPVGQLLAAAN